MTDFLAGYVVHPGTGVSDDPSLKASQRSTGGALSVFETTIGAGPPLHVHEREDECFYVLGGELSIRCGDDTFDAPAGSFVFLPRGRPHRFWARSEPARLLLITVPAGIEDYFRQINTASTDQERHEISEQYRIRVVPSREETSVTYRLVPAEGLGRADLERVQGIFEAGFPAWLRADFGSLLEGRQPGEQPLALIEDDEPVGFAMLRSLGPTGWMYLRYFVVDEARRGQGLGGILWTHLTERLRPSYSLLVLDVEDPDEPGIDQAEAQIRSRRIAFYRRHNAFVLPVTGYRTPHGDDGEGPWTPMRLMAAGLTAGDPPTAAANGLRAVVEAVYLHRWSLAPDHPQVSNTQLAGPR